MTDFFYKTIHSFIHSFIHLFIYSFMFISRIAFSIIMDCITALLWGSWASLRNIYKAELAVISNFHHWRHHGGSKSGTFYPMRNTLTTDPWIILYSRIWLKTLKLKTHKKLKKGIFLELISCRSYLVALSKTTSLRLF